MEYKNVRIAIATPETDAKLAKKYNKMGVKAKLKGEPRKSPCCPGSMIDGWWLEGYDSI